MRCEHYLRNTADFNFFKDGLIIKKLYLYSKGGEMPFTINEDSLLIKGRRGDTAAFTFNFEEDISKYTVNFYIKKNINDKETVIEKEFKNPSNSCLTVNLSTDDTNKLCSQADTYNTYFWGLRISSGTDFAQTIIPQEFKNPPMMYIYPSIEGA